MATRLQVEGLTELADALDLLPTSTERSLIRSVLLEAAEPIQQQAQAAAPRRPDDAPPEYFHEAGERKLRRPGTLKVLVQEGTKLTRNQARLARKAGKSYVEVYVGTRDPVGRLEEFGTGHSPPHPFLRPAWDANKEAALETVAARLAEKIEQIRAKAAAKFARIAAKNGG